MLDTLCNPPLALVVLLFCSHRSHALLDVLPNAQAGKSMPVDTDGVKASLVITDDVSICVMHAAVKGEVVRVCVCVRVCVRVSESACLCASLSLSLSLSLCVCLR